MVDDDYQKYFWENINNRRNYKHPAVKAFAVPKIEIIKQYANKKKIKILDVGGGNGFFSYYLQNIGNVTVCDISETMLRMNPVKNQKCCDAMDLKFKNNSYDLVFCSNLLHHLSDPLKAVAEMKRVSKKYVVLSEPNRTNIAMFLFALIKKSERGALKFNLKYLKNLCIENKLKIIKETSQGSIVPNKTPTSLIPFLKIIDFEQPFGFYNIVICKK